MLPVSCVLTELEHHNTYFVIARYVHLLFFRLTRICKVSEEVEVLRMKLAGKLLANYVYVTNYCM